MTDAALHRLGGCWLRIAPNIPFLWRILLSCPSVGVCCLETSQRVRMWSSTCAMGEPTWHGLSRRWLRACRCLWGVPGHSFAAGIYGTNGTRAKWSQFMCSISVNVHFGQCPAPDRTSPLVLQLWERATICGAFFENSSILLWEFRDFYSLYSCIPGHGSHVFGVADVACLVTAGAAVEFSGVLQMVHGEPCIWTRSPISR